jgi:AcrR family transcriptional regulator
VVNEAHDVAPAPPSEPTEIIVLDEDDRGELLGDVHAHPAPDSTRDRVLRAAAEVFGNLVFERVELSDIAERAGLDVDEVEAVFSDTAALLVEAAGRGGQAVLGVVLRSLSSGLPSPAVMAELIHRLQTPTPSPMHRLIVSAFAASLRDADVRRELEPHLRYARSAISVVVEQALVDGFLDDGSEVEPIVDFYVAMLLGSFVMNALELERPDTHDARMFADRLVEGLLRLDPS